MTAPARRPNDPRELTWGVVPPEAAHFLVREYPDLLRLLETRAQQLKLGGSAQLGGALMVLVSTTRGAARARAEVLTQACSGSPEVPQEQEQPSSRTSNGGQWATTREAAEVLGVSDRQVRNLLSSGRLCKIPGRGPGHRVAKWSLDQELERRRSA